MSSRFSARQTASRVQTKATRMRSLLFIVVFATGCVGELTPIPDEDGDDDVGGGVDSGTSTGARQTFERDVFPILTAKCGAGCHLGVGAASTQFVAANVATSYTTVIGFTSVVGNFTLTAPIYALVVPGPHSGRTYTATEQAKVQGWLAEEAASR